MTTLPIDDLKIELRKTAFARRDALPAAERAKAAEVIAARPFPIAIRPGTIVSGFSSLKSEINPIPLMRALADQGAQLPRQRVSPRQRLAAQGGLGVFNRSR